MASAEARADAPLSPMKLELRSSRARRWSGSGVEAAGDEGAAADDAADIDDRDKELRGEDGDGGERASAINCAPLESMLVWERCRVMSGMRLHAADPPPPVDPH